MLLRGSSTDFYHQGKGYAKKSLMLLPGFIHNECSYIDEIVLAVNVKNKQHILFIKSVVMLMKVLEKWEEKAS